MLGSVGIALLQFGNDAIADVHLIVEILTLQVVKLQVEQRTAAHPGKGRQSLAHHGIAFRQRLRDVAIQRTDDVEADMGGVVGV